MIKFLTYIIITTLVILSAYVFAPESGTVEIHNSNFRIETSIAVFLCVSVLAAMFFSLCLSFIFWFLGLKTKLRNSISDFFYKRNIKKILDTLQLIHQNKLKEASKEYDAKAFSVLEHKFLTDVEQRILEYRKEKTK